MARCRAAISCSICPAARRCFRAPICATAICAPIRAIPPRCCAPCSRRAISPARFDKPRYITFTEDLCAHSRSRIVGCHRCLDLCPDRRDRAERRSCGDRRENLRGLRPMRRRLPDRRRSLCAAAGRRADAQAARAACRPIARRAASSPIVLLHDEAHGAELIDALARHGDGLPAHVLPLAVNEVTQVGLEAVAAAFAYGASALRFLLRARPRHDVTGLRNTIALAEPILAGLGFGDRPRRHHRDRRSGCAGRDAARHRAAAAGAAAGELCAGRRQARRACGSRSASCSARRRRRSMSCALPARRAVRRRRDQCRGLHALPRLRVGLPDRRAVGRHRAADAALRRGRLRAMRAVQGDLSGEGHHAQAADRLPRRHRRRARAEGGSAVRVHPLRQAVRREEHDRARRRPSSKASTGCSRARRAASTSSRCARTAASP